MFVPYNCETDHLYWKGGAKPKFLLSLGYLKSGCIFPVNQGGVGTEEKSYHGEREIKRKDSLKVESSDSLKEGKDVEAKRQGWGGGEG